VAAGYFMPTLSVLGVVPVSVPVIVVVVFTVAVIIAVPPLAVISRFFHFMPIVFRLAAICAVAVYIAIKFPLQLLDVLVAAFSVVSAGVGSVTEEHEATRQRRNKARFDQHFRPDHRAPPLVRLMAQG
jgi:hypothetical protein